MCAPLHGTPARRAVEVKAGGPSSLGCGVLERGAGHVVHPPAPQNRAAAHLWPWYRPTSRTTQPPATRTACSAASSLSVRSLSPSLAVGAVSSQAARRRGRDRAQQQQQAARVLHSVAAAGPARRCCRRAEAGGGAERQPTGTTGSPKWNPAKASQQGGAASGAGCQPATATHPTRPPLYITLH